MTSNNDTLRQGIKQVQRELSLFQAERRRFDEFREAVSRIQPTQNESADASKTTQDLVAKYRETVMSTPDFEAVYDETLGEHIEQELSPAVAESLLSDQPFTQKDKRKVLVTTSAAIERRDQIIDGLDTEIESLQTAMDEVENIESEVTSLPPCSVMSLSFEVYLRTWKTYEELEERCNCLLTDRQQYLTELKRDGWVSEGEYIFNEYLYGNLETSYPVLSAVTRLNHRIKSCKQGSEEPAISQSSL